MDPVGGLSSVVDGVAVKASQGAAQPRQGGEADAPQAQAQDDCQPSQAVEGSGAVVDKSV